MFKSFNSFESTTIFSYNNIHYECSDHIEIDASYSCLQMKDKKKNGN